MTDSSHPSGANQRRGARGEDLAETVLTASGLVVIDRNWRCRAGEIDLVALEGDRRAPTLVFCEVKWRSGEGFGSPLDAITEAKVRRLRRLAGEWLRAHPSTRRSAVRLDAVGVLAVPGETPRVTHVRGIER
ncbi:YraN family protein [Mariniluteicoccus flavus]